MRIEVAGYPMILFTLFACMGNGTTRDQQRYLDRLKVPSLTYKEKQFVYLLSKSGCQDVFLDIPSPGYTAKGHSTYIVKAKLLCNLTETNKDSIIRLSDSLALALYSNIIEDSIIVEFGAIRTDFSVEHSDIKRWHNILFREHPKKCLSKLAGFSVVQKADGSFERHKARN